MNEHESKKLDTYSPACPVCCSNSKQWAQLPMTTLYKCANCNHCFTDPTSIKVAECYGSDYYTKTHRNWFENPNIPLFELIEQEIFKSNSKSVLDIGCGNGAFLKHLAKSQKNMVLKGIDLSDAAQPVSGIEFIQADFTTHDFDIKFDVIVTLAVIEHIFDVTSFVKRIPFEVRSKSLTSSSSSKAFTCALTAG